MSYGVNDMRDGVNLSRTQVTRPLIMPTEIVNLPNLTGFLRFGRSLPVVKFVDRYNEGKALAAAFVERMASPVRLTIPAPPKKGLPSLDDLNGNAPKDPATATDRPAPQKDLFTEPAVMPSRQAITYLGVTSGSEERSVTTRSRPDKPWAPARPA